VGFIFLALGLGCFAVAWIMSVTRRHLNQQNRLPKGLDRLQGIETIRWVVGGVVWLVVGAVILWTGR
jgi:hypothetical protein